MFNSNPLNPVGQYSNRYQNFLCSAGLGWEYGSGANGPDGFVAQGLALVKKRPQQHLEAGTADRFNDSPVLSSRHPVMNLSAVPASNWWGTPSHKGKPLCYETGRPVGALTGPRSQNGSSFYLHFIIFRGLKPSATNPLRPFRGSLCGDTGPR